MTIKLLLKAIFYEKEYNASPGTVGFYLIVTPLSYSIFTFIVG